MPQVRLSYGKEVHPVTEEVSGAGPLTARFIPEATGLRLSWVLPVRPGLALPGLAYRMLASASEAEDVVQDAYLRYQSRSDVGHPRAFLGKVVTNLCLDRIRANQRQDYVGAWLPEPIASEPDPEATTLQHESLRYAFLRLLQGNQSARAGGLPAARSLPARIHRAGRMAGRERSQLLATAVAKTVVQNRLHCFCTEAETCCA